MTDKEGISLLNKIANNLLGIKKPAKRWYCETCNEEMSFRIARLHKIRLKHTIREQSSIQ